MFRGYLSTHAVYQSVPDFMFIGMSSPLSKMAGMENLSGVKDSSAGVDLVQGTPTNAEVSIHTCL